MVRTADRVSHWVAKMRSHQVVHMWMDLSMAGDQMVSLSLEENVANLVVCCEMVKIMKVLTKRHSGTLVVCRICPTEDGVAVMMKDGSPMAGDQMVSLSLEESVRIPIVCHEMVKIMKVLTKRHRGTLVVCRMHPTEDPMVRTVDRVSQ